MSLDGTYTGLIASVGDFLNRSDLSTSIPDFVVLCEANLNRLLNVREMWAFQTISISGETVPMPADCQAIETIRLNVDGCVRKVKFITPQQMDERWIGASGPPHEYTVAGVQLIFHPCPAAPISARIRFRKRLDALSIYNPTNWILSKHPDAYLYGSLLQSAPYLMDDDRINSWGTFFTKALSDIEAEDRRFVSDTLEMRSGISDRPTWRGDDVYGLNWGGLP